MQFLEHNYLHCILTVLCYYGYSDSTMDRNYGTFQPGRNILLLLQLRLADCEDMSTALCVKILKRCARYVCIRRESLTVGTRFGCYRHMASLVRLIYIVDRAYIINVILLMCFGDSKNKSPIQDSFTQNKKNSKILV